MSVSPNVVAIGGMTYLQQCNCGVLIDNSQFLTPVIGARNNPFPISSIIAKALITLYRSIKSKSLMKNWMHAVTLVS